MTLVAAVKKAGFEVARVKGNHHFVRHLEGRLTAARV